MSETIAPKDKAFLSMKVVKESMDAHAKRIGVALMDWIIETNWAEKETWGRHDPPSFPTNEQLYDKFIESINK